MASQGIKETDAIGRAELFIFKHRDLKIGKKNKLDIWIFFSHQGLEVCMLGGWGMYKNQSTFSRRKISQTIL